MPSMANITVKNAANTDVVYVAAVPSAGDRSPAKWVANALSAIMGFRPWFSMVARDNGPKTARQFDFAYNYPLIKQINGVDTKVGSVPMSASAVLPTAVVDAAIPADAFVQFGNLLASTLARAAIAEGYSPT